MTLAAYFFGCRDGSSPGCGSALVAVISGSRYRRRARRGRVSEWTILRVETWVVYASARFRKAQVESVVKHVLKSMLRPARDMLAHIRLPRCAREEIARDARGLSSVDPGSDAVVRAGISWLYLAQDNSATADGGVARHFGLESGWGKSYPETTGYIVPTLLDWHARTGDVTARERARRMLDWLVRIQFSEGGFQGGMIGAEPVVPVTFNTGQILLGLAAGTRVFGEDYVEPMTRAARWLVDTQDPDGAWRRFPTPFAAPGEKSYETHVAWGLFEAARAASNDDFAAAGMRNIAWALTKQQDNGWFADCCLDRPNTPLTHTIGYAVRGILEAWRYSGDTELLAAACRALDPITSAIASDGCLPGRLDARWRPAVRWVCLTGASQLADCYLIAASGAHDEKYVAAGRTLNKFVRRTVRVAESEPSELRGGVKGSFPVNGDYGRLQYLNWAVKFTIDANLREQDWLATP